MPAAALTLSLLLSRLADELSRQAEAVRELHSIVEGGPVSVTAAQTIDISSQHLDEIAGILRRLASQNGKPEAVDEDVLAPVLLSTLRARLAGDHGETATSGDVDFF